MVLSQDSQPHVALTFAFRVCNGPITHPTLRPAPLWDPGPWAGSITQMLLNHKGFKYTKALLLLLCVCVHVCGSPTGDASQCKGEGCFFVILSCL